MCLFKTDNCFLVGLLFEVLVEVAGLVDPFDGLNGLGAQEVHLLAAALVRLGQRLGYKAAVDAGNKPGK